MAQKPQQDDIRIRGERREHLDADLMAQIVIMMGRQLAREARGEAPVDEETLPVLRRNPQPSADRAEGAA